MQKYTISCMYIDTDTFIKTNMTMDLNSDTNMSEVELKALINAKNKNVTFERYETNLTEVLNG